MGKTSLCVVANPEHNKEGLFGYVFYHVFQILPYLLERGIYPAWEIGALHYGNAPDYITIPGAVDVAYTVSGGPYKRVQLRELHRRHAQVLGSDWAELSRIWHCFFRIPLRIEEQADRVFPAGRVLGLHYRGTDKLTNKSDSNPISQDQFLTLVKEFIATHAPFDAIFAGTDEISFVEKLRATIPLPVVNLGEVEFHLAEIKKISAQEKTDRAMLDCVLLSRCECLIETSSALPSFAKVLRPEVEVYRTAASKLFCDMPYFPVAFIPVLPIESPEGKAILRSTMASDWTAQEGMERMKEVFAFRTRRPLHHALFSAAERLGLSDLITAHH